MPIIPMPDKSYLLLLSEVERTVIADVSEELRSALEVGTDEPTFRRLFPTAYADDPERQQFFDQMTRGDLTDSRIAALTVVIETVGNETLTRDEVESWMFALNALRLVLGTRLDITEDLDPDLIDPDDPDAFAYAVYDLLTYLLGSIIACLKP